MSDNQLTKLPDEPIVLDGGKTRLTVLSHIKHLNKLWVLLLSDNQLTTLPDNIGELKELEMLLVTGNPVTMEKMKKVVKIQKISSHAQKTVPLRGSFHPWLFYVGVPLLPRPHTKTVTQETRI